MRPKFLAAWLIAIVMYAEVSGCSRSHSPGGQQEDDASSPRSWAPSADAIAAAKRARKAPTIVANSTQPRASEYDLNPRSATRPNHDSQGAPQVDPDDIALGDMEKFPPPPMPKFGSGDEADQYGLPEWERIARGELHVKRIRY